MPQRDTVDFMAAFTAGAVLGAAAALLLRPEPTTRTERILRDLAPYRKRLGATARRARKGFGEGATATAELGGALREASREVLRSVRGEVSDIVATARKDIARAVDDHVGQAQNTLRKRAKRLGIS